MVTLLEELGLVLQTVTLKLLDGIRGHHLDPFEGDVAFHGLLHRVEEALHEIFRQRLVQIVEGAVASAGDGVLDAQFHLQGQQVVHGLAEEEIERTDIHITSVFGIVVKKLDDGGLVDPVGKGADLVVDQGAQHLVLALHVTEMEIFLQGHPVCNIVMLCCVFAINRYSSHYS